MSARSISTPPSLSPGLPLVFFDAAGTLFHLSEPVGAGYARIAAAFGFALDPEATNAAFHAAFAAAGLPAYADASGEAAERLWWRDLVATVFARVGANPDAPAFADCFDALFSHYGRAAAWNLYPETTRTLELLRNHGFSLGILSNFDRRLHGLLDALGIRSHFSHIIVSSEAGAAKPDAAIFQAATTHAARPPADCILIGDDPVRDQSGALNAGFRQAHLVNRPQKNLKTIADSLIAGIPG